MADTVTSQTITDVTGSKTVMKFTNKSDGTGESLVEKMTSASLNHLSTSTKIARVIYSVNTTDPKGSVEILFEGTTNATAMLLGGNGYFDLRTAGNEIPNNASTPTGDVLLSTKNFALGDNYTIIIEFR